jgi:hypothetical protein
MQLLSTEITNNYRLGEFHTYFYVWVKLIINAELQTRGVSHLFLCMSLAAEP